VATRNVPTVVLIRDGTVDGMDVFSLLKQISVIMLVWWLLDYPTKKGLR
jgi:hypothetical protein